MPAHIVTLTEYRNRIERVESAISSLRIQPTSHGQRMALSALFRAILQLNSSCCQFLARLDEDRADTAVRVARNIIFEYQDQFQRADILLQNMASYGPDWRNRVPKT